METNEILKKLREDNGLTMKEVSEATKMATSLISDYETGKKAIGMKVAIRFADYYNISLDYLMGRTPVKQMATEQPDPFANINVSDLEKRIIAKYSALDENMRAICIQAFKQLSSVVETGNEEIPQPQENELPLKPEIQIQKMSSEFAIARGGNGMYKPLPTDEQMESFEEVTPDMI